MGSFSVEGKNLLLGALPSTVYAQAHSEDPGPNGTANVLSGVARVSVPLAGASGGSRLPQAAGTYQFSILQNQTIKYVSYWTTQPAGTGIFLMSDQLDVPETFGGDGLYTMTAQNITV